MFRFEKNTKKSKKSPKTEETRKEMKKDKNRENQGKPYKKVLEPSQNQNKTRDPPFATASLMGPAQMATTVGAHVLVPLTGDK
jgi:hypothetical protein